MSKVEIDGIKYDCPPEVAGLLQAVSEERDELQGVMARAIPKTFGRELTELLNKHSIENVVDMPDFLLSGMICRMIEAMGPSIKKTLDWRGCGSTCIREGLPNGEPGPARTMTASQYLAGQQMNAAPPSPEAAPPCPEDLIESFDARVWASEFMRRNSGLPSPFISSHVQVDKDTMITWFSNALMRGYDERRGQEPKDSPAPEPPSVEERLKVMEETDSMHCRLMETYDRHASDLEKRLDALEERAKWSADSRLVQADALRYHHERLLKLEGAAFPVERLRDMARRIAELESWLGTKKYAPEDNLASKTWTKLEQLTNRLERLEART